MLTFVVPSTHTETDVEEGPLPELGGEVVLLVGVRDEGVVRGHHGDVEMDKILEEWRLVRAGVTSGNYVTVKIGSVKPDGEYSRLSFQWLSTFQWV